MGFISWNPYNDDEYAALQSNDISFYKGVFVYRFGNNGGGGTALFSIGLGRGKNTDKHYCMNTCISNNNNYWGWVYIYNDNWHSIPY